MHKIYENDDVMMYFKKRRCHRCGNVLKRKKIKRIVKKGDPDHKSYCYDGKGAYHPYGDILFICEEYYCSRCNKSFSCNEQGEVIDAQKYYKKNIVSQNEISFVQNIKLIKEIKRINKFKWFLLIPVLGGIFCITYIFLSKLSEKMETNDDKKILLSSLFIFIGVALIIKFITNLFVDNAFIKNYQTIIMLVPSLLSFNIPTFWYINHKFK